MIASQQLQRRIERLERDRLRYELSGDSASEAECYVDLVAARRQLVQTGR
ncbi:MAG: hypothetical protein AAFY15_01630 [Cyanobacteria bacterium J06648_11]